MSTQDLIPPSTYALWREAEGVPVISEMIIEDIRSPALPTGDWGRKGVKGAFIDLFGGEESIDSYILDIPARGKTAPERYAFEEEIVVLSGSGATVVWNDAGEKQTFEWKAGALFSPPINSWRQHFATSSSEPVRLLVITNAPVIFNFFKSHDFVFNCKHPFEDRFSGKAGFFGKEGKAGPGLIWQSNFIPDIFSFKLQDYSWRGGGGTAAWFDMSGNTLQSHVAEFPVGTYKAAHRHGPGAHILILTGRGFSLMWEGDEPKKKLDWKAGSLFAPPDMWFHQHFNAGQEPARYFAVHYGYWRVLLRDFGPENVHVQLGHQIPYDKEDKDVLETFLAELASSDLKPKPVESWRK